MSIAVNVNDPTNNGISGTGSTTKTNGLSGNSASDLQSSFLTLLVAQLKNQDPTNPLQNNELTTQLAQISTVSGIEKLNTTLGAVSGQIDNSQSMQASALIDRGVMIPGNTILTGKETTTPFGIELPQAADKVTATITNKDNVVMQTLDIGKLSAGVHTFSWDGKMTDGTVAPDGAYKVTISASAAGTQLVAQPLNFALVNAVTRSNGSTLLDLGTYGTLPISEVRQII